MLTWAAASRIFRVKHDDVKRKDWQVIKFPSAALSAMASLKQFVHLLSKTPCLLLIQLAHRRLKASLPSDICVIVLHIGSANQSTKQHMTIGRRAAISVPICMQRSDQEEVPVI